MAHDRCDDLLHHLEAEAQASFELRRRLQLEGRANRVVRRLRRLEASLQGASIDGALAACDAARADVEWLLEEMTAFVEPE